MPTFPPPAPAVAICEFTPITRPLASSSGPPELPGLIGASVWITLSMRKPLGASISRSRPETIPAVAVLSRPSGKPMAIAASPTSTVSDSASASGVTPFAALASTSSTARSDDGSVPTTRALDRARVVVEAHLDLARAADDVGVGDDRPVAVDQEAGAGAAVRLHGDDGLARPRVDGVDLRSGRAAGGGGQARGALGGRIAAGADGIAGGGAGGDHDGQRRRGERAAAATTRARRRLGRREGVWRAASPRARRASRRGGRSKGS